NEHKSEGGEGFAEKTLAAHNQFRSKHCASPLVLDDELNNIAQKYAEHLAQTGSFEHSHTKGLGENLWEKSGTTELSDIDGVKATKDWYDEVKNYRYDHPDFALSTGHFTQLVWADSKQLGVGIAYSDDKKSVYVVTNYKPAGNVIGNFPKNVKKPTC
ncbi:unnamed protein product, partial [Didymodactylos carnosus]